MKIERAIDLIVELEKHDPVAPLEVWFDGGEGRGLVRLRADSVFQLTNIRIKEYLSESPEASDVIKFDAGVPLPVVVSVVAE